MIGRPVTALTESAAPPRASPSTVERDALLERQRDVHGLLAGHGIEHEQDVRGLRRVPHLFELLHQLLVDVETSRGVENDRVDPLLGELLQAVTNDGHRVGAVLPSVDGNLNLAAELLELVDRRGPLQVGGDEPRDSTFVSQEQRKLGGGRRLAGALQAREQDHRRWPAGERELGAARAHQRRQLLVHRLHDLLAGTQALQHLLAERPLAHLGDEALDDLEVDVGLEQREPDLPHRTRDRRLVE